MLPLFRKWETEKNVQHLFVFYFNSAENVVFVFTAIYGQVFAK